MFIFYHGYQSSSSTNKYKELQSLGESSFCRTVDYEKLTEQQVYELYCNDIEQHKPDLLIGHSLGGYWALRLSNEYNIPVVVVNPSLFPSVTLPHLKYKDIEQEQINNLVPKYFYLELGDEVIDLHKVQQFVQEHSYVATVNDGHHRVQYINNYKQVVEFAINTSMIDYVPE